MEKLPDSYVAFSSDCGHLLCPVTSRIQLFSTSQLGAVLSSRSVVQQLETYLLVSSRGVENTAVICVLSPTKLLTSYNVHSPSTYSAYVVQRDSSVIPLDLCHKIPVLWKVQQKVSFLCYQLQHIKVPWKLLIHDYSLPY